MSLSISLQTALASLTASQSQMQTVANNVANATTEGYTKKSAQTINRVISGVGSGVSLSDIERVVDQSLLKQLRDQVSRVSDLRVRDQFNSRIQDMFGPPSSNSDTSHLIGRLTNAVESLSATPESAAGRHDFVSNAQALSNRLNSLSGDIQLLRREADDSISQAVLEINSLLESIDLFNQQASEAIHLGRSAVEILDGRDLALKNLSDLIDVQSFTRSNGEVVVYTKAGRPLVDSGVVSLSHTAVSGMDASVNYPNVIDKIAHGAGANDITTEIVGGRLAGLIEMRDQQLTKLQSEIDRLTEVLVSKVNAAHNSGSAFPPLQTLTSTRSFVAADDPLMTGAFRVAVVDTNGALVESLDINLTPLADIGALVTAINGMAGASASLNANGNVEITAAGTNRVSVNEMTSQVTTGNETTGLAQFLGLNDLYTLNTDFADYTGDAQTSKTAALGLTGTLTFETPAGPTAVAYTAAQSLSTIAANINTALGAQNIAATVLSENGKFRLTITDTDGDNYFISDTSAFLSTQNLRAGAAGAAAGVGMRADIIVNPNLLSTGTLSSGTIAVGDFVLAAGDSTSINALADALSSDHVFNAAGGLPNSTLRLGDYAASIVSVSSTRAANISAQFEIQEGYEQAIHTRSASISEVNIDEEMSTLLVLQNAYQASARITQIVSDMMQTLVDIAR